ncbi:Na+ dependent nucleoside transporter N-terminal domain-containing protein, partial [Bacillus velezensis]|uniref:Na+ dependent nucleoside transporter N-terminal domain-containing protein n=1 Tax=Bacillus velezensis TaxID=492670 RepID=UPI0028D7758C
PTNAKKRIRIRPIPLILVLQLILRYILLNTPIPNFLLGAFAKRFNYFLQYPSQPINFLFPPLLNPKHTTFFITVLLPILFIS